MPTLHVTAIKSIGVVEEADNPGAKIMLFKRREPTPAPTTAPTPTKATPARRTPPMEGITTTSTMTIAEIAGLRVRKAAERLRQQQLALPAADRMSEGQSRAAIWDTDDGRALASLIRTPAGILKAQDWLNDGTIVKARDEHAAAVRVLRKGFDPR